MIKTLKHLDLNEILFKINTDFRKSGKLTLRYKRDLSLHKKFCTKQETVNTPFITRLYRGTDCKEIFEQTLTNIKHQNLLVCCHRKG